MINGILDLMKYNNVGIRFSFPPPSKVLLAGLWPLSAHLLSSLTSLGMALPTQYHHGISPPVVIDFLLLLAHSCVGSPLRLTDCEDQP